jgi:hypothetical protein
MYTALPTKQEPNQTILKTGIASITLHIFILLVMFFYSKYQFISYNMLNHIWFNATIAVLLLIDHAVWLHLLWDLALAPFYSLLTAYTGVLILVIAWVMEVVVPIEPDPVDLHGKFCIVLVIGCIINLIGSILILVQSLKKFTYFRFIMYFFSIFSIVNSLLWYIWRILNMHYHFADSFIKTLPHLEPSLELTAYIMYLIVLLTGIMWAQKCSDQVNHRILPF